MIDQITLFFGAVLLVVVSAMFVHSFLDKRRVRQHLSMLVPKLSGAVVGDNPFSYPRFEGYIQHRRCDFFLTVVKAGRRHILYAVYSLQSAITCDLLLLKTRFFKPAADEASFAELGGAPVASFPGYEVRSRNPETAHAALKQGNIEAHLEGFSEFSSLQLGPDALVCAKPYEGWQDVSSETITRHLMWLQKLAEAMEQK